MYLMFWPVEKCNILSETTGIEKPRENQLIQEPLKWSWYCDNPVGAFLCFISCGEDWCYCVIWSALCLLSVVDWIHDWSTIVSVISVLHRCGTSCQRSNLPRERRQSRSRDARLQSCSRVALGMGQRCRYWPGTYLKCSVSNFRLFVGVISCF